MPVIVHKAIEVYKTLWNAVKDSIKLCEGFKGKDPKMDDAVSKLLTTLQSVFTRVKNIEANLYLQKEQESKRVNSLRASIQITRAPKIWFIKPEYLYDGHYYFYRDLCEILFDKSHMDMQVGDLFVATTHHGKIDNIVYMINKEGKISYLLENLDEEDVTGVPAYFFEVGLAYGETMENMLKLYKQTKSGYFIYPLSQQNGNLQYDEDGTITKFRMNHHRYGDIVLDFTSNERYKEERVFLGEEPQMETTFLTPYSNSKKFEIVATKPKRAKAKSATLSPNQAKAAAAVAAATMFAPTAPTAQKMFPCKIQTTKKYLERPSPPFLASECPGEVKLDNNGLQYRSVANKKGVYSWKKKS